MRQLEQEDDGIASCEAPPDSPRLAGGAMALFGTAAGSSYNVGSGGLSSRELQLVLPGGLPRTPGQSIGHRHAQALLPLQNALKAGTC